MSNSCHEVGTQHEHAAQAAYTYDPVYTGMFLCTFVTFRSCLHFPFTRKCWNWFGKWIFSKTAFKMDPFQNVALSQSCNRWKRNVAQPICSRREEYGGLAIKKQPNQLTGAQVARCVALLGSLTSSSSATNACAFACAIMALFPSPWEWVSLLHGWEAMIIRWSLSARGPSRWEGMRRWGVAVVNSGFGVGSDSGRLGDELC